MKTILCTTDFSRPATKVCRYAAQLAQQVKAKLILLYASHPGATYSPAMQTINLEVASLTGFYSNKLGKLARDLEIFANGRIRIETIIEEGFATDVISATANELKPDLLIMSTTGESPKKSELFGSVTTEMIKKSPVPLMLVPPKSQFKPFENVYLALDISAKIDAVAFQKMIDTLKGFNAIITIFSVVPNPESGQVKAVVTKLRQMLQGHPHIIDIVEGDYFVESFLANAHLHKADLMIVFPKHHNFLQRWFIQTNTEELNFKIDLPLIAIS